MPVDGPHDELHVGRATPIWLEYEAPHSMCIGMLPHPCPGRRVFLQNNPQTIQTSIEVYKKSHIMPAGTE